MSVHSYRNAKSTAQPKVRYLDNTIISNQQILRFQVSVEHSSLMAKENSLQNLWSERCKLINVSLSESFERNEIEVKRRPYLIQV